MSAEIVDLRLVRARAAASAPDSLAWVAFCDAKNRADATLSLRDMHAALRAWEAWLVLAFPNEAERRQVWP